MLDRGFNSATAALLLTGRFARAAELAGPLAEGESCARWVGDLRAGQLSSLSDEVVWSVVDSVTAHLSELNASGLRPCLPQLLEARPRHP